MITRRTFSQGLLSTLLLTQSNSAFARGPALSAEKPISRIAFGSCIRQMQDAPLLNTVVEAKPDLFLMIGDVI